MDLHSERRYKHERVVEFMERHGLEAVLLTRRCNFSWYTAGARNYVSTGDDVGNSTLVVTPEGATVLTTNIEATRLREEDLAGSGIEVVGYPYCDADARARAFIKAVGRRRAAVDVPPPDVEAPRLPPEFNRLRWVLTDGEVERYRSVAGDAVAAVESACRNVQPGQTEHEVAGLVSYELRRRGMVPWVLLVAADERVERHRHPLPTGRHVRKYLMVAVGAERGGLVASCTRLACFGKIPGELDGKHRAVVTVDAALISATRPGATLGRIFAEAQAAYATVGWADQWMFHHQGGPTGYLPREARAGPGDPTVAMDHQAFAWNPTIIGTKSEDTILCLDSGPRLLAGQTDWPMLRAEWKGFAIDRPAILVR